MKNHLLTVLWLTILIPGRISLAQPVVTMTNGVTLFTGKSDLPPGHRWRTNNVIKQYVVEEVVAEPIPLHYYAIIANRRELWYLGAYPNPAAFQREHQEFCQQKAYALLTSETALNLEQFALIPLRERINPAPPLPYHDLTNTTANITLSK